MSPVCDPETPPTEPDTQSDSEKSVQTEGSQIAERFDPFRELWGRLVPCHSSLEVIDLPKSVPVFTIGRGQTNNYKVDGPKISSCHCEISRVLEPDRTYTIKIVDLSTNGTYVNGIKLSRGGQMRITHGDEISLGQVPGKSSLPDHDSRYIFRQSASPIRSATGFHAHYQLDAKADLGKGTFGVVKRGWSKKTGHTYAVKIISKTKFAHNPKHKTNFERELAVQQTLRHYNITRLVEYFEDESTIYIVLEYVAGGDLLQYIVDHGAVPEHQSRIWVAQMVDALVYTHNKPIAHRDLKPENILLTADDNMVIKIADFGLAKSVLEGTFLKTVCGTPSYMAPEVVLNPPSEGYDCKVDCWSLGAIIFAMMTNTATFLEDENIPTIQRILTRQVDWDILAHMGYSALCINFIQRLIVNDPARRMSMREARSHPWIAEITNSPPEGWVGTQESQWQKMKTGPGLNWTSLDPAASFVSTPPTSQTTPGLSSQAKWGTIGADEGHGQGQTRNETI